MVGLTDRIRLRPLTAGLSGDVLYLSSEEAPIRLISPQLRRVWTPVGGEPVIGRLGLSLDDGRTPVDGGAAREVYEDEEPFAAPLCAAEPIAVHEAGPA